MCLINLQPSKNKDFSDYSTQNTKKIYQVQQNSIKLQKKHSKLQSFSIFYLIKSPYRTHIAIFQANYLTKEKNNPIHISTLIITLNNNLIFLKS